MKFQRAWKCCAGACLVAALVGGVPTDALACTQVYMGEGVTTTGDTYVGRSEDYASRHAKAFGIQMPRAAGTTITSDESDFTYTFKAPTLRYTYVRDLPGDWNNYPEPYSEAGTNERGVSISSTLSTDYNDQIAAVDPLCNPDNPNGQTAGIGEFSIPDVVLSQAATAREGVEILGRVVDETGSNECNQIIIADPHETWIFSQLSGHQWIAIEMGANEASVNPNMGNLRFAVDLNDPKVCLHSKGLLELPKQHNLLKTFEDGTPDIAGTYGKPNSGAGQNTRYAQGRAYFGAPLAAGTDYTVNEKGQVAEVARPELTFTPGAKVDTFTALRSVAARGEQDKSLNANLNKDLYAIGNHRTVESHIFQIRDELTADIATVQWTALSRAEFSLFIPSYSALLTKVDTEYYPLPTEMDESHQGASQRDDSVEVALQNEPGKNLDYIFMDINTLAFNNRSTCAENVRGYLDALQHAVIAQQDAVDAVMRATPAEKRSDLANELFAKVTEQSYAKCKKMLDELRAYVKAGNGPSVFVPSDYDPATKQMKTPLEYAGAFVAPVFKTQPASIEVEQGAKDVALTAQATVADGVEGSDAQIAYQWFKANDTGEFVAVEGATKNSLPVDTSVAGVTKYQVVATTPAGKSVTSDVATVTVKEPAKVPTPKPEPPVQKPSKKPVGAIPQTGDSWQVAAATAAAAGAACFGAAVMRRRPNGNDA